MTDDKDNNLGYVTLVDGVETRDVFIDTSEPGEHTVLYRATDNDGNTTIAERTVLVGDPVSTDGAIAEEELATTTEETIAETNTDDIGKGPAVDTAADQDETVPETQVSEQVDAPAEDEPVASDPEGSVVTEEAQPEVTGEVNDPISVETDESSA